MTLTNKYRPLTLDQVIGQQNVKNVLMNQIEKNMLSNGYIFSGPSGTGKTTVARILANLLKAELIEIDAASYNGVDNIRELNDMVKYASINHATKVYIIDEAHMLTKSAWNAFLKTLEEPSNNSKFIMCTTEVEKIPNTIMGRSTHLPFSNPTKLEIKKGLEKIVKEENATVSDGILEYIIMNYTDGVRNAINMLERVLVSDTEDMNILFNKVSTMSYIDILKGLGQNKIELVISTINDLKESGVEPNVFIHGLLYFLIDIRIYILTKNISDTRIPEHLEGYVKDNLNLLVQNKQLDINTLSKYFSKLYFLVYDLYKINNINDLYYLVQATFIEMCL